MRRICRFCKKKLQAECDYCHSLNVRPSRTKPDTMNCGNCLRRGIPLGVVIEDLCHECTQRQRRTSERHGELKYESH